MSDRISFGRCWCRRGDFILRYNRENKSVFLGCECYPQCCETMTLFEWEKRKLQELGFIQELEEYRPSEHDLDKWLSEMRDELGITNQEF